jgi:SAM-dependent methyltransferase
VTIPLARMCEHVIAVDVSPLSIERLEQKCAAAAITNISAHAEPIETFDLAPGSLDLVVSNYAMHHLDDAEKARALRRAMLWLRPGGRLVIGDMMFGRGAAAGDRKIIAGKLWKLLGRGPGGWWRIVKNAWRFGLRRGERPLTRGRWEALAREVGFVHIRSQPIVAEAALLIATRPTGPAPTRTSVGSAMGGRGRGRVAADLDPGAFRRPVNKETPDGAHQIHQRDPGHRAAPPA